MNAPPERSIIEEVALIKGISESFVEKDWYVTQVIGKVSEIKYQDFQIIFTGGTALSKAHNLILRFSEDIDFRVITPGLVNETKSKQRKTLFLFLGLLFGLSHPLTPARFRAGPVKYKKVF